MNIKRRVTVGITMRWVTVGITMRWKTVDIILTIIEISRSIITTPAECIQEAADWHVLFLYLFGLL